MADRIKTKNELFEEQVFNLDKEINEGWRLYGQYMDANKIELKEAKDVRKILSSLIKEKADLLMSVDGSEVQQFIDKHKERLDAKP